jgi:hypothetical protein
MQSYTNPSVEHPLSFHGSENNFRTIRCLVAWFGISVAKLATGRELPFLLHLILFCFRAKLHFLHLGAKRYEISTVTGEGNNFILHLHLTESQQNRGERYDFTTSFTRSTTDYQCITGKWRQVSFTSTQLYINHLKVNETYFPLMNAVNLFQDKTKNIGAESSFRPNR